MDSGTRVNSAVSNVVDSFLNMFTSKSHYVAPPNAKVVLLNSPIRPVTAYSNEKMRCWYDFKKAEDIKEISRVINVTEWNQSADHVINIANYEASLLGGNMKKIILSGFSQGWWVAYNTFLRHKEAFGGVIGISGYSPPTYQEMITPEKKTTPIFAWVIFIFYI